MIKLLCIVCLLIFLAPIILDYKKKKDFFSPVILVCLMNIFYFIPHMWIMADNEKNLSNLIVQHNSYRGIDKSIINLSIILVIAFISNIIGINSKVRIRKKFDIKIQTSKIYEKLEKGAFIAFVIGVVSFSVIMYKNGGISNFISNIMYRSNMLRGLGIYMGLMNSLTLCCCIYTYSFKFRDTLFKRIILSIYIGSSILMWSCFGGRTPTLHLLIYIIFTWNYSIKKVKIFKMKNLLVVLAACVYILAVPILRQDNAIEYYLNNPKALINDINEDRNSIIKETSLADENIFVINYFEPNNLWLGKSYIDLGTALIPSSIYPEKPPVDDGVYIWNLIRNNIVKPSTAFDDMIKSSWPIGTMGIMYANFWIPGVIIGMYLLGRVQVFFYRVMKNSEYDIMSIILYTTIMLKFQLSNLYIYQTGERIFIISIIFLLFIGIKISKINNDGGIEY